MAEHSAPKSKMAAITILGLVAVAVVIITAVWMIARKINNKPWDRHDQILAVFLVVGAIVAVGSFWRELGEVFGTRGAQYNLNAALVTVLVFGCVTLVNYSVLPRFFGDVKMDLTKEKFYTLADQTVKLVRSIDSKTPIEIIGIIPMSLYERSADAARTIEVNQKRLKEYGKLNPGAVTVEVLDPNISQKAIELIKKHALSAVPGVVIRFKDNPDKFEGVNSLDEAEVTRGLMKLLDNSSRNVYVLSGHGEEALQPAGGPDAGPGLSLLKTVLTNDRFEVKELRLTGATAIPADAAALIDVGAKQAMLPPEKEALTKYLAGGGRLLCILDPDSPSDMGDLLKPYGVEWHPEIVSDMEKEGLPDEPQIFLSVDYGTHDAVSLFKRSDKFTVFSRTGYFRHGTVPADMEITDVVSSSKSAYATPAAGTPRPVTSEDAKAPAKAPAAEATKVNGPFPLVVTVATKLAKPGDKDSPEEQTKQKEAAKAGIRICAIGAADFVSGQFATQGVNLDLAANMMAWLTDRTQIIGIRAKNPYDDEKERKITLDDAAKHRVLIFVVFLPMLLVVIAGAAVVVVRARR
jgi:ABC-type uncharacterized transport system involved in gliding motility auxiliary subunit